MPNHPEINEGDRIEALGVTLEVTKIEGENVLCMNLKHNKPFTVPLQQLKMIRANEALREQLANTDAGGAP